MKILEQEKWSWSLYKQDDELILSVVCGSVGIYEQAMALNKQEIMAYKSGGSSYLSELANRVRSAPDSFVNRVVKG